MAASSVCFFRHGPARTVVVILVVLLQMVVIMTVVQAWTTTTTTIPKRSTRAFPSSLITRHSHYDDRSLLHAATGRDNNGSPSSTSAVTTTTITTTTNPTTPSSFVVGSSSNHNSWNLKNTEKHHAPRDIRVERYARLPVWPVWTGVVLFFVGLVAGPERASQLEHYVGGRVCPMILEEPPDKQEEQDEAVDGMAMTANTGRSSSSGGHRTRSPFLLLVHHNHNFWNWDVLFRFLTKQFLPEGFPSHPHRGFTTLTYFLPDTGGGFVHRDSMGIRQAYGSTKRSSLRRNPLVLVNDPQSKYDHIAQWLFTGAGLLHEEMFDLSTNDDDDDNKNSRHELYQLWINVPSRHKLDPPRADLLACGKDIPSITTQVRSPIFTGITKGNTPYSYLYATISTVHVLAGSYYDAESTLTRSSTAPTMSDLNVLHVIVRAERKRPVSPKKQQASLEPYTDDNIDNGNDRMDLAIGEHGDHNDAIPGWTYEIPTNFDTLMLYVRRGSCQMTTVTTSQNAKGETRDKSRTTKVPIHSTVFLEKSILDSSNSRLISEKVIVTPTLADETVDLLVLAGQPLYETYSTDSNGLATSTTLEPLSMQGSMVMNYPQEIQEAYRDYQMGKMGQPWDHELTDEQWQQHVRSFPCQYRYDARQNSATKRKLD